MNDIVASIAKWIAVLLAASGGGALVAYGVFTHLGKTWLDQHFKKKLEDLKHAQQKEIELLRHQINSLFSRVSKVHEKEFEVLPKAWLMLNELHGTVMLALDLTRKSYPDFKQMPDDLFEEFLGTCRLTDYQKDVLRKTDPSKRYQYFSEEMAGIYLDDANEKLRLFRNYLIEYSIFMTETLREKFSGAHKTLSEATISYGEGRGAKNWEMKSSGQKALLDDNLKGMIADVESAVQKRLHYHDA